MARDDWFRRASWPPRYQKEFFVRLARARPHSRAKYLRIQAGSLTISGRSELIEAALELLEIHFQEFQDPFDAVQAHATAAACFEGLNQIDAAIEQHRLALKARRKIPNVDVGTELDLPWLIVQQRRIELYGEALRVLKRAHCAFPVQFFKAAAIRAIIADFKGERSTAARHAQSALDAAALCESQFRYHKELGLVGADHAPLIRQLRRSAGLPVRTPVKAKTRALRSR